ncbi:acetoin utilization protein AcuC [Radiobacillus kanasensis]|uniref:acetoin utilization protein AcuC n=1 Tax=Radiobacillus kanasensis TaxID=2844358 RepID=UPI001E3C2CA0|nr:acetoin utilization protein AcuC [Radiobacillus kanasensis]UFT98058.1 acetoin utilization protein AcuC [Radiobacillus kanasensis]
MKCDAKFVYSEDLLTYQFGTEHPFNQQRIKMTKELLEAEGILTDTEIVEPRMATEEELLLVHTSEYVDVIQKASKEKIDSEKFLNYGIGTEDTPIFPGMHDASRLLVGSSLTAVDQVMSGEARHALNLGGGLHHGFPNKASGFCIYNDAAVAIQYIRKNYNLRVLYVDTDAHHGDGVQNIFYNDPNVCTLSIHETGRYLFPGTGQVHERGVQAGYGYSFNVPVDAFTEDESFIEMYESSLIKVMNYFQPDIIISQNGADAHCYDPLTHLCSTMQTFEFIPKLAHQLAHDYCDGKWIALGGGGYDIWRVVPRAWAQIWSVMQTDTTFQGTLPIEWIKRWEKQSPVSLPHSWHDDEGIYPPIPRKEEITEKNKRTLDILLQYTKNQDKFHNQF